MWLKRIKTVDCCTTGWYAFAMKREIIQTTFFVKTVEQLIKKGLLSQADFDALKRELVENPKIGKVISGTGGIRKTRLKSRSGGKSGGFRVCYFDLEIKAVLYLIFIYAKNEQEDISPEDKKILTNLVKMLKEAKR